MASKKWTEYIGIRVDPETRDWLAGRAENMGVGLAVFIRTLIFQARDAEEQSR